MLLANLRIGLHEQTRLQPEIVRALDAPIADRREVKTRLLERLFGDARAAGLAHRLAEHDGPLDDALQDLMDAVRGRLRQVVTAHLMTLDLPGGRVRLGADVVGVCPPSLLRPQDADLRALLTRIDPVPDGTAGSGAREWANLGQRMHFITELFRTRQEDVSLLQPPAELAAG
jgi:hypothetical protein